MEQLSIEDCGPTCWLKKFTRRSDSTTSHILAKGNRTTASDEHLRQAASQLYKPLLPWQTRILRIEPGQISDPLKGSLFVADLISFKGVGLPAIAEIVQYEALSYAWGQPSLTQSIYCNGIDFPITESLSDALRQMRLQDKARYVWSDAVSINQSDPDEKSRQVANMFVIYQKATRVLACLGKPNVDGIGILEMTEYMAVHQEQLLATSNTTHDEACANLCKETVIEVVEMLNRPWFSRTWVRQEVFANQEVDLICGSSKISFENFCRGLETIQKFEPMKPHMGLLSQAKNLECLHLLRVNRGRPERFLQPVSQAPISAGIWLTGLLAASRFDATDPRDKVYGAVAMIQEQRRIYLAAYCRDTDPATTEFPIDYRKGLSVVYQDAVKYLINSHRNLQCLSTFYNSNVSRSSDLPSWTIDLRQNIPRWYLQTHSIKVDFEDLKRKFAGSRGPSNALAVGIDPASVMTWKTFQGRFQAPVTDLDQHDVLALKGRRIGTIGQDIGDTSEWDDIIVGKTLQRMPVPHDVEFVVKQGKRSMKASEAVTATVRRLMAECSYKCVDLVVPESWNMQGEGSELCTDLFVPSQAQRDTDIVTVLHGSVFPFVLRSSQSRLGCFQLLGPALWLKRPVVRPSIPPLDPASKSAKVNELFAKHRGMLDSTERQYEIFHDLLEKTGVPVEDIMLV